MHIFSRPSIPIAVISVTTGLVLVIVSRELGIVSGVLIVSGAAVLGFDIMKKVRAKRWDEKFQDARDLADFGHTKEAIEAYLELIHTAPDHLAATAAYRLGHLLRDNDDLIDAERAYQIAIDRAAEPLAEKARTAHRDVRRRIFEHSRQERPEPLAS